MQAPHSKLRKSVMHFIYMDIAILLCLCSCGCWLLYAAAIKNMQPFMFFIICGTVIIGIALWSLYSVFEFYRREQLHTLKFLEQKSERIVWCFYSRLQLMPFGVKVFNRCRFFIYTLNGDVFTLRAGEQSIREMITHLQKIHPGITVGYSIKNEQLFKADPHLLRND